MPNSKQKLNKEQLEAVEHNDGPLLIVAGAGTGKTTVLTNRLAYLVDKKLADADEILLLTFTEKATGEMEDRALKVLPYGYVDLWINTFHGFCERILRQHALDIGLNPDFKILSQTEQWVLIKKNLKDKFNLDYYAPLGNPNKFIHELIKYFSKLKDEDVKTKDYLEYAEGLKQDSDHVLSGDNSADSQEIKKENELADAYHTYNSILLDEGYLDFGDLICYTIRLFKERPNILKHYQDKFKYIMVDEFQDTNWAQYELLKILAKPKNNLAVVGDDDQSIYKFRGASLSNIMQFKDDYPGVKEIVLNKNYRSGQVILDTAYDFIQNNNPNRLEAKLKIDKRLHAGIERASEVNYFNFENEQAEVSWIANKILEIYEKNNEVNWSDFAILLRANNSAEKFVQELKRKNIPNLFVSLRGLYYKPIILDCLAFLRLLDNYHESSAIFRVLNMDVFKISHSDIVSINKFARNKSWSLFEALRNIDVIKDISGEAKDNVGKLLKLIKDFSLLAQTEKPSKLFIKFIYESGIIKKKDHDKDREIFSQLNQFLQKIKGFEDMEADARLKDFMQYIDLELEAGETGSLKLDMDDDDLVKIMTVHASKGLEFDYVFMADLVDKKFPTINRRDKIEIPETLVKEKLPEGKNVHIEEERRLFYVALTRAKKNLFLSGAKDCGGVREKKPSLFITEMGINQNEVGGVEEYNNLIKELADINKPEIKIKTKYALPAKFSFSQIEAYKNCPLQYKFSFVLKIPVDSKDNFIFGRVMHNTLKDFLDQVSSDNFMQADLFSNDKNKEKPTYKDLLDFYKKRWQDDGYEDKEKREKYKRRGLDMLKKFYDNLESEGWPEVAFLEKNFTGKVAGYFFRGAIDRIDKLPDGTYEVMDYKTSENPPDNISRVKKDQLVLYKIIVEEVFGLKVSKLSFYYLINGQKLSFDASEKNIEKLEKTILEQIEKIKQGEFAPPKSPPFCNYCDFREICEFRK